MAAAAAELPALQRAPGVLRMFSAAPGSAGPASYAIRPAAPADLGTLFALANDAYHDETGDRSPGFKITTRFIDATAELLPLIETGRVLVAEAVAGGTSSPAAPAPGGIGGMIAFEVHEDAAAAEPGTLRAHFGPFAVARSAQGSGVGRALLDAVFAAAAAAGCASVDCEVVNPRLDILPMYLGPNLGFRVVGRAPFPAPERCSRPCHFVLLRKAVWAHRPLHAQQSSTPA